jgi:Arc/MetJ-type ribon-helix-helix transcriptional regulator
MRGERSEFMTSMQIEMPHQLAATLRQMVQNGWFQTEQEIVRVALVEYLRRHQAELTEQFQREDIAWALSQMPVTPAQV